MAFASLLTSRSRRSLGTLALAGAVMSVGILIPVQSAQADAFGSFQSAPRSPLSEGSLNVGAILHVSAPIFTGIQGGTIVNAGMLTINAVPSSFDNATLILDNNFTTATFTPITTGSLAFGGGSLSLGSAINNGVWTGAGITSNSIFSASPGAFAVGYADGSANTPITGQLTLTNGATLVGDDFLQGNVGFADLVTVAQNFGNTGNDWSGGNFTYDPNGSVGFADLVTVAQNFGGSSTPIYLTPYTGLSPIWQANLLQSTAVNPEPASLALLAACSAGLLARRRSSHSVR